MQRGFTLIELSTVLLIIGVITGAGLVTLTAGINKSQYDATVAKINTIETAVLNYSVAFGRIPCPADLALTPASTSYGLEAANPGSCTGGTPAANYTSSSGVAEGTIPVRALQIPDSMMFDGWGHRFRYAVDPTMTITNSLPVAVGGSCNVSNSAITVTGAASSTAAIYAIISHGANGHGGFTRNGVITNSSSVNTNELQNCHCNSSAVTTGNDGTYIQKSATLDTANKLDNFDDIVVYKEGWQMRNASTAVFAPACLYITDSGNNAIRKYVASTGTWSSITSSFNAPYGIVIDSSSNILVADTSNNKIKKYTNSTGTWNNSFISGLSSPAGLALDSSGNIFVANTGGNNIRKYNSSGALQTTYTSSFSSPYGVYVDKSNNIYVSDTTNKLQKYNGSSWSNIGSSGTLLGQFSNPRGMYVDSLGNLWVAEYGNNRVQKYDGTSWYAWGGTSAGTAPGKFNAPVGITGDALGNIWVVEYGNNRIQVFSNGIWNIFANYSVSNTAFNTPKGIAIAR